MILLHYQILMKQIPMKSAAVAALSLSLLGIGHSATARSVEFNGCGQHQILNASRESCHQLSDHDAWNVTESIATAQLSIAFSDISGSIGETEIRQLAELGILDSTSDVFQPSAPITRGEFVTWMVKTYNVLHRDPIRLPTTSRSAFPDMSPSHPYFTYIQAAYEAGLLAGFTDGTFGPDEVLTREQMIVLKAPLDTTAAIPDRRSPESLRAFIGQTRGFSDVDEISEDYLPHVAFDLGNAASGRNFERVYGRTRIYAPQTPVTRAEAAILLSRFRRGGTLADALEQRR